MGANIDPGFEFDYAMGEMMAEGIAGFFLIFLLLFVVIMLAVGVTMYVLQALGMYTIAKRRGIHHPWLSWLPIGNMWILGSISDQYQYVAKGKIRNRRKVLLGMMIAIEVLSVLYSVTNVAMMIGIASEGSGMVGASAAGAILLYAVLLIVAIVASVFQYIALFDLYKSCNPDDAVLYLVLSILFSISMPVFMFISRKKDLGMPPRKVVAAERPAPTVIEPAAPAEQPIVEETTEE